MGRRTEEEKARDRTRRSARTPEQIEKDRAYQRAYYLKNNLWAERTEEEKDAHRKLKRDQWANMSQEKKAKALQRNRDYSRLYYATLPDRQLELMRADKRAHIKEWRKNNAGKVRHYQAQRRAATKTDDPRIEAIYFIAAWLRDQGDNVHVDHIIPLARGGEHVYDNLQILPAEENLSKGAKLPQELIE